MYFAIFIEFCQEKTSQRGLLLAMINSRLSAYFGDVFPGELLPPVGHIRECLADNSHCR